jgi:pimeloyl-ACP methyl ester carboxylesterase
VLTPTFTGMGEHARLAERAHLAGVDVTVDTHVQDIAAVVELEDLTDVVSCGHSYGGVPVTGAADRVPERLRLLIYVDALVPRDGESALTLLPEWFCAEALATADSEGRVPMPAVLQPPRGWVAEHERIRYVQRLGPQPLGVSPNRFG